MLRREAVGALGEEFPAQAAVFISGLVRPAALQLGDHQIDEILVAFRGDDASQVEAVQAGFGDPRLSSSATCSGEPITVM